VTGKCDELDDEEVKNLYCRQILLGGMQSRKMRWAGRAPRMGGNEKVLQNFSRKT
jgi:hypothetical protein